MINNFINNIEKKEITKDRNSSNIFTCGFCNESKSVSELKELIMANGQINSCRKCRKEIGAESEDDVIYDLAQTLKKPSEIVAFINDEVIGQEETKKTIATEIYNHYLRIINKEKLIEKDLVIKKNNILLLGPTGTGKTFIIENISKALDIPFVSVSSTSLTASGYAGSDIESILSTLMRKCKNNPNRAKFGIVYIDEIDKKAKKNNTSNNIDVGGEAVQQSLLTMIDGDKNMLIPLDGAKINQKGKMVVQIDTTNILFICGGAFVGIEDIIKRRQGIKADKDKEIKTIGFNTQIKKENKTYSNDEIRQLVTTEDLSEFGFIPEFIGRFPVICNLESLNEEQFCKILKSKHGLINEYANILNLQKKKLVFSPEAVTKLANLALNRKVGARGLRYLMAKLMKDILYNAPIEKKKTYTITDKYVSDILDEKIV